MRFGQGDDQHEIMDEELGCGAAARVFCCRKLLTGEQRAVKCINLQRLTLIGDVEGHIEKLDREVRILRDLRHLRIVTLHYVHRTENFYFVVMELIRGGELFNLIVQNKTLSEVESRYIFRQLLEGIGYMHAKRIIHRDLKPENILIVGSTPAPPPAKGVLHDIKIADFGLAKILSEGVSVANTFVGTPQYYAPEVIRVQSHGGSYNQAADYWGLGVVLFVMLCGRYPFDGKKMPMEEQIQSAAYKMDTARWKKISEDAKDLVRGLLRVDPDERLRMEECAYHPWVSGGAECNSPLVLPLLPKRLSSPMQRARRPAATESLPEHLSELPVAQEPPQLSPSREADATAEEVKPDAWDAPAVVNDADSRKEECESRASSGGPKDRAESGASVQSCTEVDCADDEEPKSEMAAALRRLAKSWGEFVCVSCPKPYRQFIRCLALALTFVLCMLLLQRLTSSLPDRQETVQAPDIVPPYLQAKASKTPAWGRLKRKKARRSTKARWYRPVGSDKALAAPPESNTLTRVSQPLEKEKSLHPETLRNWETDPYSDKDPYSNKALHEAPERNTPLVGGGAWQHMTQTLAQNIAMSMAQSMTQTYHSSAAPRLPQLGHDIFNSSWALQAQAENQTIFRLSELLKLQVSIAGSLEMACLAFRHADPELAEATRQTSRQAREVFQLAANVVARYANVAQQVSQVVLPDLHLAVQEDEPKLAASLLDMVKSWVAAMKVDGEETRHRYAQLQAAVLSLVRRAQDTKSGADRRLAVAVQVSETLETSADLSPSPSASSSGPGYPSTADSRECVSSSGLEAAQGTVSMNSWTRQLFEQLTELTATRPAGDEEDAAKYADRYDINGIDMEWKRDLVDLLFLAPGVVPSSLPKLEPLRFENRKKDGQVPSFVEDDMVVEDDSEAGPGASSSGSPEDGDAEETANAVVTWVHTDAIKSEAEFATHSSAALLRALRELKRVDGILQGCSAFWTNMDGTVQTLAQMKDHTESLVKFAASSPRLRERFEQRLEEYTNFWASLERLCRQYCSDHQAASARMHEFIREMTDAADVIDTAESAKAGLMAGRREREMNHSYAMADL